VHRLLVLIVLIASATPASSQTDVSYSGTLDCEPLPRSTERLSAPVTLTISGRDVRFERAGNTQPASSAGAETGQGRIGGGGRFTLRTLSRGERDTIRGTYSGRLTAAGGVLRGRQSVSIERRIHSRACTITIRR
jgi:hypothetical protein